MQCGYAGQRDEPLAQSFITLKKGIQLKYLNNLFLKLSI